MAPKIDGVNAEVQMMKAETKVFRDETREDFRRVFEKLEKIHDDLATLKATPACPDPGACVRVGKELEVQRAALEDHNRRLTTYDLERQKILGGKTMLVAAIIFIGWCVDACINWFHKG